MPITQNTYTREGDSGFNVRTEQRRYNTDTDFEFIDGRVEIFAEGTSTDDPSICIEIPRTETAEFLDAVIAWATEARKRV